MAGNEALRFWAWRRAASFTTAFRVGVSSSSGSTSSATSSPFLSLSGGICSHYENPVFYCLGSTCHSPPVAPVAWVLPDSHLERHGGLRGRRTWWAWMMGVLGVLGRAGRCDCPLRWTGDEGEWRGCQGGVGWLPRGPYLRLGQIL